MIFACSVKINQEARGRRSLMQRLVACNREKPMISYQSQVPKISPHHRLLFEGTCQIWGHLW